MKKKLESLSLKKFNNVKVDPINIVGGGWDFSWEHSWTTVGNNKTQDRSVIDACYIYPVKSGIK